MTRKQKIEALLKYNRDTARDFHERISNARLITTACDDGLDMMLDAAYPPAKEYTTPAAAGRAAAATC